MTALALLAIVTLFVLVLTVAAIVAERIKPDTDLDGWTAGDPMPGARRRPCLDARCRIDHDAVNPWTAERGR